MNKSISNLITLPIIFVALVATFVVFAFVLFGGSVNHNRSIAQETKTTKTGVTGVLDEFKIEIEKIGVIAPVIQDVDGANKETYNQALLDGVAHYKGTALPNQGSNIFIFGHSSPLIGATGNYKEIFKDLGDLEFGDIITITYLGEKIEYTVSEKRIVEKTEMSVLNPTDEEQLTLMACWPIGSNDKRIIVIAEP